MGYHFVNFWILDPKDANDEPEVSSSTTTFASLKRCFDLANAQELLEKENKRKLEAEAFLKKPTSLVLKRGPQKDRKSVPDNLKIDLGNSLFINSKERTVKATMDRPGFKYPAVELLRECPNGQIYPINFPTSMLPVVIEGM